MSRPKLNKINFPPYKVERETTDKLRKVAIHMGYIYNDTAAMGEFLDMISEIDINLFAAIGKKKQNNLSTIAK